MLDEIEKHGEDEQEIIEDESADPEADDDDSPEITEKDESDKKEQAAKAQESKWLSDIKEGKRKLEDMPKNLGWLKKRVEAKLEPKKEVKADELETKIRATLVNERAQEEFNELVDGLDSLKITPEQDAQLKFEYEEQLAEFQNPTSSQKLKALDRARRLVGIKDPSEISQERKRRGMTLPTFGGRSRETVDKDKVTEMEKRLGQNLPKGYKA